MNRPQVGGENLKIIFHSMGSFLDSHELALFQHAAEPVKLAIGSNSNRTRICRNEHSLMRQFEGGAH